MKSTDNTISFTLPSHTLCACTEERWCTSAGSDISQTWGEMNTHTLCSSSARTEAEVCRRGEKKTITESKARQSINFCSKPGIALVRFASLFQTGIGWFQVSPSYRTREGSQHILISLPFMLKATQAEDEPFCSVRFQTSSGHHQHLSPKLSCIMGHSAVKPLHQPWCPQRYLSSPTLFPQKGVLSGVLSPLDCKELYTAATLSHYSSIWRTRGKTLSSGS